MSVVYFNNLKQHPVVLSRDENLQLNTATRLGDNEDPGPVLYGVLLPVHPSCEKKPEPFTWTWLWPATATHSKLLLPQGGF